jgi:hypothetical protein
MASARCTQPTLRIAGDASGVTHGFCLIVFSDTDPASSDRPPDRTAPRGFIRICYSREHRMPRLGITKSLASIMHRKRVLIVNRTNRQPCRAA